MPDLDKQLNQLSKKHKKARELVEQELEGVRRQAESARTAREEAQTKLNELEERRPSVAAAVFSAPEQAGELEDLDKEMGEARRQMEIAGHAEEQAAKREQEIAKRLEEAEHDAAESRYDFYAKERKERTLELEKTLDSLTATLDALLALDASQRQEEPTLGLRGGDMPYAELLDNHLSLRLVKYIHATRLFASMVDMRTAGLSLLEKDFRTQTRPEQKAKNAAEVQEAEEHAARQESAREEAMRHRTFQERRRQLQAWKGYDSLDGLGAEGRRRQIDEIVNAQLATEYPDLIEEERLASLERQREEVRSTLLSPGEDYESLSEERRAEVDAAVDEWLGDGEVLAEPGTSEAPPGVLAGQHLNHGWTF